MQITNFDNSYLVRKEIVKLQTIELDVKTKSELKF